MVKIGIRIYYSYTGYVISSTPNINGTRKFLYPLILKDIIVKKINTKTWLLINELRSLSPIVHDPNTENTYF